MKEHQFLGRREEERTRERLGRSNRHDREDGGLGDAVTSYGRPRRRAQAHAPSHVAHCTSSNFPVANHNGTCTTTMLMPPPCTACTGRCDGDPESNAWPIDAPGRPRRQGSHEIAGLRPSASDLAPARSLCTDLLMLLEDRHYVV
jgi:hypothetical protein